MENYLPIWWETASARMKGTLRHCSSGERESKSIELALPPPWKLSGSQMRRRQVSGLCCYGCERGKGTGKLCGFAGYGDRPPKPRDTCGECETDRREDGSRAYDDSMRMGPMELVSTACTYMLEAVSNGFAPTKTRGTSGSRPTGHVGCDAEGRAGQTVGDG